MADKPSPEDVLSASRFAPYLAETDNDHELAMELYRWGVELAGSWHSHISYVEVAVRNSIDRQLRHWNSQQTHYGSRLSEEWTGEHNTAVPLHHILASGLASARIYASKEVERRSPRHPRYGVSPSHEDVLVHLPLGSWSRLFLNPGESSPNEQQKALWDDCLKYAFPFAKYSDQRGQMRVGRTLETFRKLRNRISHHDNLLRVQTKKRLNESLALIGSIDPGYPELIMQRKSLRRLDREDPRRRP